MELPHIMECELEWRRQRTHFFHNGKSPREDDRDIVPIVEVKPFSKKVWRKARSIPAVSNITPFAENEKSPESPRTQAPSDRYTQDPRLVYKDTIFLLTEMENQKLNSIYSPNINDKDQRLPRFQTSVRFPSSKPRGSTPMRHKPRGLLGSIQTSKTMENSPRISIKGEQFSDIPPPPESPLLTRAKSMPANLNQNGFYKSGRVIPNPFYRMEANGQVWCNSLPAPILINNCPLRAGRQAWTTHGIESFNLPEFLELDDDEINEEYSKIIRRSKLDSYSPENFIMKTFTAPTRGEISIKVGLFQNLSRDKLRELRQGSRPRQTRESRQKDEPEQHSQSDYDRGVTQQSFVKSTGSFFKDALAGSPLNVIDDEHKSVKSGRSAKSKSVIFEDEMENVPQKENGIKSGLSREDTTSSVRVDLPQGEVDIDSRSTSRSVTPSARPRIRSAKLRSRARTEGNIIGKTNSESNAKIENLTNSVEDVNVNINEPTDENRGFLTSQQTTFMTATSREGTPICGNTPRDVENDNQVSQNGFPTSEPSNIEPDGIDHISHEVNYNTPTSQVVHDNVSVSSSSDEDEIDPAVSEALLKEMMLEDQTEMSLGQQDEQEVLGEEEDKAMEDDQFLEVEGRHRVQEELDNRDEGFGNMPDDNQEAVNNTNVTVDGEETVEGDLVEDNEVQEPLQQ